MNTLKIESVSKIYPNGVNALKNINLTITNGMFGLLGPNGAGKSSLMRTLATLQEPSQGHISFNGIDSIVDPQNIRKQLGYLPQEFGVYPKISALQLLDHIAILKGVINTKERKEQIEALLHQTNLYAVRKKAVSTFSGGMRQRFGIAQALLGNPKLIIVDEPTAGLDPEERNRFHNLLSTIGEHVIIILSTHIVEDVKIWSKTIAKNNLDFFKSKFDVLSSRLSSGKLNIRVLADTQPDNGFISAKADLEDVYFSTLSKNQL